MRFVRNKKRKRVRSAWYIKKQEPRSIRHFQSLLSSQAAKMKSFTGFLFVLAISSGFCLIQRKKENTTEKAPTPSKGNVQENENEMGQFSADFVEVKEEEIPEGALVYVLEELKKPKIEGETLETADNIVFRPLFQYRYKKAAIARRNGANGYRRRYFTQRIPDRYSFYPRVQYSPFRNQYYYG